MSILEEGDELLHFDGGTHRLFAPGGVNISPQAWKRLVEEHVDRHLRGEGVLVAPELSDHPVTREWR